MTKDVLITISGVHMTDGDNADVEMITTGDYYQKEGKHYIMYDEVVEGSDVVIKNVIKIRPDGMDIIKRGASVTHMTFEQNKKKLACYSTPVGEMMVGIQTNRVQINESEDSLKVKVNYSLDINYQHVSDCDIILDIQSRAGAQVHLHKS